MGSTVTQNRRALVGTPGCIAEAVPSYLLPGGDGSIPEVVRRQRNNLNWDHILAWCLRVREHFQEGDRVMDIGCGVGLVDWALMTMVPSIRDMILLDSTGDETHVPMSDQGYWHNDLDLTRHVVRELPAQVHDVQTYDWSTRAHVVMSTLSWGFHYPISLYFSRVRALRPRLLIVDLRKTHEIPGYTPIDKFHIWGKATTHVFRRGP